MSAIDRLIWLVGLAAIIGAIAYREQIAWAYKNRATLEAGATVLDQVKALGG